MEQFIGKLDDASGFTQTIAKWLDEWAKSVQIVTAQMERSKVYDQAERVNDYADKIKYLNEKLTETQRVGNESPSNIGLARQVDKIKERLAIRQKEFEVEKAKLELLTNQDILTPGAGKRLGIDIPAESGPAKHPPTDRKGGCRIICFVGSGCIGLKSSAAPANKKRGLLEGFQDFAADQNASAFFGLAGDLENYRESQMSALDIETEMHEKRMKVLEEFSTRNTELAAYTNSVIESEQDQHAKSMAAIDQARFDAQVSIAQQGLGNLATLMNSQSRKAFETGKIAAIAMATINGIQSVVASYKWGLSLVDLFSVQHSRPRQQQPRRYRFSS